MTAPTGERDVEEVRPSRLARRWRQLRVALLFLYFGLGGAIVTLVVLPLRRLFGADEVAAQRTAHRGMRSFVAAIEALGIGRVVHEGTERLADERPLLVIANHPSRIDGPLLGAIMPQADFLLKHAWTPVNFGAIHSAGYLPMDEGPASVDRAVARLESGRSIVWFPEGTRSPFGGLGKFQRGLARVAIRGGFDIQPVLIRFEPWPRFLMKGHAWYDVPDRRLEIRISLLPPVSPAALLRGDETESAGARKLTRALEAIYREALGL